MSKLLDETVIPVLKPGETVELKLRVKILDEERSGKWWQVWKPVVWRDATEEEMKRFTEDAKKRWMTSKDKHDTIS